MSRARARQRVALQLHAIERVRRQSAEAQMHDARFARDAASDAREAAAQALAAAEQDWSAHLRSRHVDIGVTQLLGAQLIAEHQQRERREVEERSAADRLQHAQDLWRGAEARVRSGDAALRRFGHKLAGAAERRTSAQNEERTTWRWFRR